MDAFTEQLRSDIETEQAATTNHLKLTTFGVSSWEDSSDWLDQFERIAKINKWSSTYS